MAKQPELPAGFLADLDVVCPKACGASLPAAFVKDLEGAYAHALVRQPRVTAADLASLAKDLDAWRDRHRQLLQQYLTRLPADDPLLSPVSLFGTMDYGRLETAHTRALAWLLGDQEHGFGYRLLETLLRHLISPRQVRLTRVDRVEGERPVASGPAPADAGRLDVFAEGRWEESGNEAPWVLVLEAKIDADEGDEQLSQYDDWLEGYSSSAEVVRVFLTPDGRGPATSSADWRPLTFVELAGVFRRVPGLQDRPGYHFLRYYLTGVLRDVCRLPVPISPDCANPYAAVDYLRSAFGTGDAEGGHGEPR
jgi:hypothetical protein